MNKQIKKNRPALRFPEFEGEWESKKLDDITVWASGGTPSKNEKKYWNGEIPWISASSMRGNYFDDSDLKITEEGLANGSRLAPKGTILILVRGSMLFKAIPVGIATTDVAFNQDVKSIRVKKNNLTEFLLYWFVASENKLLHMVTGTGIGAGKLDLQELKNLNIHLPPLPEQKKIAQFLTAIDTRLQQLAQKVALLEDYKKGVLQQLFSRRIRFKDEGGKEFPEWEEKRLGDGFKLQGGFAFKSSEFKTSGIPVIRISNISNDHNYIDEENLVFYYKISNDSSFLIEKGDLLVAMSGATTGKASIYNLNTAAYLNQRVGLFRMKKKTYCYEFLVQLIFSPLFKNQLRKVLVAGAQPNVSSRDIENFKFLFPTYPEQKKIANFLGSIDRKIELSKQQLDQTQQYKKGLLQQMFV